ncbi:hypothetical protein ASPBRDRAFT_116678 [Aspergillus brasiliensis CBS 101740]|uniref:Uncharacterized protein n=1 Tax=Aspergillus brasiliensis (strain CBS 101740 / IMI 381727 / IBT 21946) TaxID=767769 RepID=A0A1L9UVC8_ASPBC|nr:hypothetical protein ASPBRDRAFT_116678 [Aspergillus brasiliensis CBS 101740]
MPRFHHLILLSTPPAILTYTTHRYLSTLEAKYPPVDPTTTTSLALRTPSNPTTQHCPEIDVYEAKHIPVKSLVKRYTTLLQSQPKPYDFKNINKATLTNAWILTLLNTRPLKVEGSIIGLIKNKSYSPGDTGLTDPEFIPTSTPIPKDTTLTKRLSSIFTTKSYNHRTEDHTKGFEKDPPRPLLNSAFTIQHSSPTTGLLLSWRMPDEPRLFFEKIARWGYPWRLMSGGRHEINISDVYIYHGEEVVDVRFASAHDYEIVGEEQQQQKIIPAWVGRLHRGYARVLVDCAVRDISIS